MLVGHSRTKSKLTLLPRLRFKVMSRPANERLKVTWTLGLDKDEKVVHCRTQVYRQVCTFRTSETSSGSMLALSVGAPWWSADSWRVLQWEWTSDCILHMRVRLLPRQHEWKLVECASFLFSHRSGPSCRFNAVSFSLGGYQRRALGLTCFFFVWPGCCGGSGTLLCCPVLFCHTATQPYRCWRCEICHQLWLPQQLWGLYPPHWQNCS